MSNSTLAVRPTKPRPDFPLFPHRNGRWAKKVRGSFAYFTHWATDQNGEKAVEQWLDQKDALLAGRKPPSKDDGVKTLADLVNGFYTAKKLLVDSGDREQRTLDDYELVGKRIGVVFGRNTALEDLTPADFARLRASFAKTHGPVALTGDITRTRVIFKWGHKNGLLKHPIEYGDQFDRPTQRTLRLARAASGPRMFERDQLLAMLNGRTVKRKKVAGATLPLRAMLLLAINGGLGNSDVSQLPLLAVDLKKGWLDFPRPKTGVSRRIPLWPETVQALKKWIPRRPTAKARANRDLVFITNSGNGWAKTRADNPISKETAKLLKRLDLHAPGLNFYSVRRTFRTIASESRDEPAADSIMGHVAESDDMAARYRQRISEERLIAVTNYVRNWLFGKEAKK